MQIDFKNLKLALTQLAEERGLTEKDTVVALEMAFGAAYKKEYAKVEHMVRAQLDMDTGDISFFQAKQIVDESMILPEGEEKTDEEDKRVTFNDDRHIWLKNATMLSNNTTVGEDVLFPLEKKTEFGRIAAQAAKQAVFQNLREAEKRTVLDEFSKKEGELVVGEVRRYERGSLYVDLGKTIAIMPFAEQIRGERFAQGERVRSIVLRVDTKARRGNFVTLSRAAPEFVKVLFKKEVPEYANDTIEIKRIVREPRIRTKMSVISNDENIDAVGAFVGPRGVRVLTVISELGNEKIDIIEHNESSPVFIEESLSPAKIVSVDMDVPNKSAKIVVPHDQTFFAAGFAGKNALQAHRLTGYDLTLTDEEGNVFAVAYDDEVDLFKEFINERQRPEDLTKLAEKHVDEEKTTEDTEQVEQTDEMPKEDVVSSIGEEMGDTPEKETSADEISTEEKSTKDSSEDTGLQAEEKEI